jgi:hypothetical protein
MKYLISLVAGIIGGAALFLVSLYYNPFASRLEVSPLAVTEQGMIELNFSSVPAETLLFTNDGESIVAPHPDNVNELWESAIKRTWASAVLLSNARGEPVGIGIKFSSESEQTNVLKAEAMVDSVWHIYLPGRGTLYVDQTENYWSFLRDIVIPARWSSSDSWRGSWYRNVTNGPGALGTARVSGGSGIYEGLTTEAVEAVSVRAYSANDGPVAMSGNLSISLPATSAKSE